LNRQISGSVALLTNMTMTPEQLLRVQRAFVFMIAAVLLLLVAPGESLAHNVTERDAALIVGKTGPQFLLYTYLGAKHMVTGYDHLLFLLGVIFYLTNLRQIALFVSLFALGHSITLIGGVLLATDVNPYLVDAVIGLSVAYKGFDNLNGFTALFGERPDEKLAVFVFGLFHGLGLATKLQDLGLAQDGLLVNLISFNLGVELGQLMALVVIVFLLRRLTFAPENDRIGNIVNAALVVAGFGLMAYQINLYLQAT
jgi:hypothetical protein